MHPASGSALTALLLTDRAGWALSGGMQRTLPQTGISTARMHKDKNEGGY